MGYIQPRKSGKRIRYAVMQGGKSYGVFGDYDEAVEMLDHVERERRDVLAEVDFATLVEDHWLPRPGLSPTTKQGYAAHLRRHAIPVLGRYRARSLKPSRFQALLDMVAREGAGPDKAYQLKSAMSSAMRVLVEEGVLEQNPVRSCRTEPRRRKARQVLSPDDVLRIEAGLTPAQRLFARFLVETGVRFGEATEARVMDLSLPGVAVAVRRSVADVGRGFHPDGTSRFFPKTTKSGKERVTSVTRATADELGAWIAEHALGAEDLLFPRSLVAPLPERPDPVPVRPPVVGGPAFGGKGWTYPHGTLSAYTHCGCRCQECRVAMAQYGQSRRKGRVRSVPDDHLPRDVWRRAWVQAVESAGIGWAVRTHDLRHASATWAVKSGVDLHSVRERMGHHSLAVTEVYLHAMVGDEDRISGVFDRLLG